LKDLIEGDFRAIVSAGDQGAQSEEKVRALEQEINDLLTRIGQTPRYPNSN
jgi:hypothetical protein